MGKKKSIILNIIIIFLLLSWFVFVAYVYYKQSFLVSLGRELKFLAYSAGIWYAIRVFSRLCERITVSWKKYAVAVTLSVMFTGLILLYNAFLHCLDWNFRGYYQQYGSLLPYGRFLSEDILYSVGWGAFRYPTLFVICLISFVAVVHMKKHKPKFWEGDLIVEFTIVKPGDKEEDD